MNRKQKKTVIQTFKTHKTDTGSPQVQIAILTNRINDLIKHLETHKKDNHSRRGLLLLVGKRKKLLRYLERHDKTEFLRITTELDIRISADQRAKKQETVASKQEIKAKKQETGTHAKVGHSSKQETEKEKKEKKEESTDEKKEQKKEKKTTTKKATTKKSTKTTPKKAA